MGRRRRRAKHGSTVESDICKVMVRAQVADPVIGALRMSAFGMHKAHKHEGLGSSKVGRIVEHQLEPTRARREVSNLKT